MNQINIKQLAPILWKRCDEKPQSDVSYECQQWHLFARELKQWILRLQNQNVSTCMFCGAESTPPDSKTKFLEHITQCPHHPLYQVRQILTEWSNLKGHDRCWHHPEVLQKLCGILQIPIDNDPCLPSRSEFEQGCKTYQEKMYDQPI